MHASHKILGIRFDNLTLKEAASLLGQYIQEGRFHYVATPALHRVVYARRKNKIRKIYADADLNLSDGIAIIWASRILGVGLKERIPCPDLLSEIFKLSVNKGYRISILRGGDEGVTRKSIEGIRKKYPGINICGAYTMPYDFEPTAESPINSNLIEQILQGKPQVLIFALGCPKEEEWLWGTKPKLQEIPLCLGVGGALEIYAGRIRRAPKWMQSTGLEWVFRLTEEPLRLYKRYLVDGILFLWFLSLEVLKKLFSQGCSRRPNSHQNPE